MGIDMLIGCALVLASNLIAAFSQVLLKQSSKKNYPTRLRSYMNPLVISAYALFFVTTLGIVSAVRFIPLTLCVALDASGQIFVPVMSRVFLHERISRRRWAGMAAIVLGIIIFSV